MKFNTPSYIQGLRDKLSREEWNNGLTQLSKNKLWDEIAKELYDVHIRLVDEPLEEDIELRIERRK